MFLALLLQVLNSEDLTKPGPDVHIVGANPPIVAHGAFMEGAEENTRLVATSVSRLWPQGSAMAKTGKYSCTIIEGFTQEVRKLKEQVGGDLEGPIGFLYPITDSTPSSAPLAQLTFAMTPGGMAYLTTLNVWLPNGRLYFSFQRPNQLHRV